MYRRLTICALLLAALVFALVTYSSVSPIGANAATVNVSSAGVLSPQRVPQLLANASSNTAISNVVSGAKTGGQTCIIVQRNGATVAASNENQSLIPASTIKLLTATAALDLFGNDATFTTTVSVANLNNGVVSGPLYLVGGGDPLLFSDAYATALNRPQVHTSLNQLADQVAAKGVKTITGGVVGDDSRFDQTRYLSTWDPSLKTQGQIGPTGGLQVNQGFTRFVGGRVPADNPTLDATNTFTELLKAKGVSVTGSSASGIAPAKASLIASIVSPKVSDIVSEMLTQSDNSTAEMMLRNIGVKASDAGTFAAGTAAVKTQVQKDGISLNGVTMNDGSGLDRNDKVTCATLVSAISHGGFNGVISNGLPKAGQTGTLADRMNNTPAVGKVRAKTGTLSGISALAGWVTSSTSDQLAFAVINNGVISDQGRAFEDGLAESLASMPATASANAYASTN